ncbi:MAG: hypothetical protein IT460_10865 [Planctomycetes bacterium]|nr:hypothetical protein [Planctomycetota bacterium]
MRAPRVLLASVVAFAVGTAATLFAEDVDLKATLAGIQTAVAEKHYGRALADLQTVLAEVSRLRADTLKRVLPAAPEGWTAGEPEAQDAAAMAAVVGATIVRRGYERGEARVTAELIVGGGMWFAPLQALLANPAFLPPQLKAVTVKGRRGVLEHDAEAKHGTLQLLLSVPNALLRLEGDGVTREDLESTFVGAFDLDKVEKAAQD